MVVVLGWVCRGQRLHEEGCWLFRQAWSATAAAWMFEFCARVCVCERESSHTQMLNGDDDDDDDEGGLNQTTSERCQTPVPGCLLL